LSLTANAQHLSYKNPVFVSSARSSSTGAHDFTGWIYSDLMRIFSFVAMLSGAAYRGSYWSAMLLADRPSLCRFFSCLRVVEILPVRIISTAAMLSSEIRIAAP